MNLGWGVGCNRESSFFLGNYQLWSSTFKLLDNRGMVMDFVLTGLNQIDNGYYQSLNPFPQSRRSS